MKIYYPGSRDNHIVCLLNHSGIWSVLTPNRMSACIGKITHFQVADGVHGVRYKEVLCDRCCWSRCFFNPFGGLAVGLLLTPGCHLGLIILNPSGVGLGLPLNWFNIKLSKTITEGMVFVCG